jgi:FAD/FMN-containing dehydrogenase
VNSCIVSCPSWGAVLAVYGAARQRLGEVLSAIEFLDRASIDAVLSARPELRDPLPPGDGEAPPQFFVIVETGGAEARHDNEKLEGFLEQVVESGEVVDGAVAQDAKQAASFWAIRDNVSVAMNTGSLLLYDVSLPQQRYYELVEELRCAPTGPLCYRPGVMMGP